MGQHSQSKVLVLDQDKDRADELCNRLKFLKYEPVLSDPDQAVASIRDSDDGIAIVLGDIGGHENHRILAERLTAEERDWLNQYHATCRHMLRPRLGKRAAMWLNVSNAMLALTLR